MCGQPEDTTDDALSFFVKYIMDSNEMAGEEVESVTSDEDIDRFIEAYRELLKDNKETLKEKYEEVKAIQ
jgi:hypothetical protein